MTKLEFTQLATKKFNNLSTEELIKLANKFKDDFIDSDTATCKFDAVLNILSKRMPMQDLMKFCDSLYE